jgi:hypothetical protein
MLIAAQSSPERGIGSSLHAVLAIDVLREFDRDRLAEVLRAAEHEHVGSDAMTAAFRPRVVATWPVRSDLVDLCSCPF